MNRWMVPVLAAAMVLLTGCGVGTAGSHGPGTQLPLASAALSRYIASYRVSGPVTGTATVRVAAPSGGTVTVQRKTSISGATEDDVFVLAAKGLQLRTASERITGPSGDVTIFAQRKGQSIQEHATVNGRVETPSVALASPWQVNNVLLTALSGLQVRSGEKATIEDVLLQHATSTPVGLAVGKEMTLSTPVGSLRCFPITISAGGNVQTAWYEAAAPHAMVKYVNGQETYLLTALSQ